MSTYMGITQPHVPKLLHLPLHSDLECVNYWEYNQIMLISWRQKLQRGNIFQTENLRKETTRLDLAMHESDDIIFPKQKSLYKPHASRQQIVGEMCSNLATNPFAYLNCTSLLCRLGEIIRAYRVSSLSRSKTWQEQV